MEQEQRPADNSVHVSVFSPRATHADVSLCRGPRPVVVVVGGGCMLQQYGAKLHHAPPCDPREALAALRAILSR